MKLSFKAFIIATLMQSANANYDCSLCVAERAARPTTVKQAIEHLNIARMKQLFPLYYSGVLNGGDKELPYMQCWDTTGIEDFAEAFSDFKTSGNSLNGVDLNCWDTSSATTMTSMFAGTSFNGSLNSWDTSKVTDMAKMFYNMPTFNRSLNHFNTAKVTSMNSMFKTEKWVTMNPPFNQDLSTWDVSSVTDFHLMFRDMINFNSDLSRWDVSSAEKMTYMFYGAEKFNGDITSWDVSKVTSMGHMFQNAKMFNQNLSGWNVSNIKAGTGGVDGFGEMFMGALAFNQCMYAWDAIVAGELPLNMEFYRMFWGTSCPAVDGRSDDWGWANRGQSGTWCKDTECSPIPPPPAPVLPFGRFEVRHREVGESKEVGKLLAMEPRLDTELFFEVGPSITDTSNLGLEVYGTTGLVDDATMACADGKLITGDVLSTKAFTLEQASGTAGFTLDLTKLEETLLAYSGDKVDICARIKYDNTIQTFVDTRIVIDRTYTADLGETVTIGDPSSGKFNKADDTTVSVTEFFCDAEKTDIGTNLEFRAGQDIRICVNPVQDQDSLFEYKVETFNDVKCTFVGTETVFDIVFDDVFNVIETDTASGTGSFFFVLQSTFVALSDVRQLQCTGKVVLSSTRKPQSQRLLSSRSSSNYDIGLVRTLQETLEDVETTFSIDLTIIDEDSGASCASSTAAALAVGSLAAVLL